MDGMAVTDGEVDVGVAEAETPVAVPPPVSISREQLVEAILEALRRGELRLEVDGETVRGVE